MSSRMPDSSQQVAVGQLLLAEPFMMDPYFRRAAVLLCEHGDEGSLGFIINKQLDIDLNDLLQDFPEFESTVYYGGPVQTDTIHYLHNVGELLEDSVKVAPGIFWGGSFEKLKFLVDQRMVLPDNIRFMVGYSGWTSGQLAEEMAYGSWVLGESDPNYVFKQKPARVWQQAMSFKSGVHAVIAQMPEGPLLN